MITFLAALLIYIGICIYGSDITKELKRANEIAERKLKILEEQHKK